MSLHQRLRRVFDDTLRLDPATADGDLRFLQTPGWDSLGAVLLTAAIEQEFAIEIDVDEALRIDSFGQALETLHQHGVTG